jgi:hypothetical protein
MLTMRDLERQYRITARSIPEVIGPMEQALSRIGMSRSVTFRGRKLSNEAFINAALLHLLSLEPDEQEQILTDTLGRLESILDEENDGPRSISGTPSHPETGEPLKRTGRKRKSG